LLPDICLPDVRWFTGGRQILFVFQMFRNALQKFFTDPAAQKPKTSEIDDHLTGMTRLNLQNVSSAQQLPFIFSIAV